MAHPQTKEPTLDERRERYEAEKAARGYHSPLVDDGSYAAKADALIAALEREVEALKVCGSCRYCAWDQSVGHPYCTAHQNWFVPIAYPCRIEWFRGESRWTRRKI